MTVIETPFVPESPVPSPDAVARARRTLLKFVGAAAVIGAVPVPATSAAIIAHNAALVNLIAADLGVPITVQTVLASTPFVVQANVIGRAVFVEAARAGGWFAGPFGVAGVCALGASTSALQAWMVGELAIAIARNGGFALSVSEAQAAIRAARNGFDAWRASNTH